MITRLLTGCFRPLSARLSSSSEQQQKAAIEETILGKQSAIAAITGLYSSQAAPGESYEGIGVLVYPSLILTTHTTIPSPAAALNASFSLRASSLPDVSQGVPHPGCTVLQRKLLPQLFFATDSKLNVTVIGCEFVNPDLHPLGFSGNKSGNLEVGSKAFILGHDKNGGGPVIGKLCVGSASVTSATFPSMELTPSQAQECWLPGSAGFDHKGDFSFLVTEAQPSKLRGVSIPTIKAWLEPHWHAPPSSPPPTTLPLPPGGRRATDTAPPTKPIDMGAKMQHSQSEVIRTDHLNPILEDSICLSNSTGKRMPPPNATANYAASDTAKHDPRMANSGGDLSDKMSTLSMENSASRFSLQLSDNDSTNKKRKASGNDPGETIGDGKKKLSLHEAFRQERRSLQLYS